MEHTPYQRDESEAQRLDRNLNELLQELRVIGSGVQILFGFLLGIAFQNRFPSLGDAQKAIYVATLCLAALTAGLLIAPVAVHRMTFREGIKDDVVKASNRLSMLGMTSLAMTMTGSVLLVADQTGGWSLAIPCAAGVAAVLAVLWWAIPAWVRHLGQR